MAKVTLVVNTSWNVFNFRLSLLDAIVAQGHSVTVVAPRDEYTDRIPYPHQTVDIQSTSLNPFTDLRAFWQLLRIFRAERPDIVLLYTIKPNIYGNLAARILGVHAISNIAGLGAVFGRESWLSVLVRKLYRIALAGTDRIFFQNRDDMSLFVAKGLVSPNSTGLLPGSGVDTQRFDPQRFGPPAKPGERIFLLAGRMLWDKGVSEYVDAARKILSMGHSAQFRLLGFLGVDNPQAISRREMDAICQTEGIEYLGVSDQVENILAEVDCVVLPSKYREGTPRVLLEACAMEKVIITTDSPGCRDLVEDGATGYLCKAGDSEDLLEKMLKIIEANETDLNEMGRKARENIINHYDERIVIDRYLDAIESIMVKG
jgi:glycosyltransferase involved in cell wall biosynthesis